LQRCEWQQVPQSSQKATDRVLSQRIDPAEYQQALITGRATASGNPSYKITRVTSHDLLAWVNLFRQTRITGDPQSFRPETGKELGLEQSVGFSEIRSRTNDPAEQQLQVR